MPYYKPAVDYVPHNFNSTVVSVNNPDLDGLHVIDALDTIEVEPKEVRWTTQEVASGASIHVHNPKGRAGTIKITLLDASGSTDILNVLANSDSPTSISIKDANAPNLDCSSLQARVNKVMIKRGEEVDVPEWTFVCTVLNTRSGAYAVQTVA